MPSISPDPYGIEVDTPHTEKADRMDPSYRVLQKPVPANDNWPPLLTTPFSDNLVVLRDPSHTDEKAIILAFALVAVLILIAWVYALNLPATVEIDRPPKGALALNFRAAPGH